MFHQKGGMFHHKDKTIIEQVKIINELEPEDKVMVFRLIDTIVTKKKFKDFFQENINNQK